MVDLGRFAIDDGLHLPRLVIDEDASVRAGTAQYRAACSCSQLNHPQPGTREQALLTHLDHTRSKLGPSKGPAWLPVGARVTVLVLVMLIIWAVCYGTGQAAVHGQDLTGAAAKAVLGGSHLTGLGAAFSLMIAVRRYIAPTRD